VKGVKMGEGLYLKGVVVELIKPFSVLRETLERIGIANRKEKKIFPSCYAKKVGGGKIAIYHFKELLKEPNMEEEDIKRKNTVLWLLMKWNLVTIKDESKKQEILANMLHKTIFILSKKRKDEEHWNITHKYHFEGRTFEVKVGKGNLIERGEN
jgi:hypothetical protein